MSKETVTSAPGWRGFLSQASAGRWAVEGEQRLEVILNMTESKSLTCT